MPRGPLQPSFSRFLRLGASSLNVPVQNPPPGDVPGAAAALAAQCPTPAEAGLSPRRPSAQPAGAVRSGAERGGPARHSPHC